MGSKTPFPGPSHDPLFLRPNCPGPQPPTSQLCEGRQAFCPEGHPVLPVPRRCHPFLETAAPEQMEELGGNYVTSVICPFLLNLGKSGVILPLDSQGKAGSRLGVLAHALWAGGTACRVSFSQNPSCCLCHQALGSTLCSPAA